MRPKRLPSNLYQFREGTGQDRCVLDCITSLQNGADLLWIETEKPNIEQIAKMVDRVREVIPNAKLAYNNSPSFNWTLNFRWQVYDAMKEAGKDVSKYNRAELMKVEYDNTPLAIEADELIRTFQADSAKRAGIFHHLITLPTYHTAALSTDNLAKAYFGEQGMLGYVKNVQREEIRQGIACVQASEHGRLGHRRRPQGILRRRGSPEGGRRAQHDEPVRLAIIDPSGARSAPDGSTLHAGFRLFPGGSALSVVVRARLDSALEGRLHGFSCDKLFTPVLPGRPDHNHPASTVGIEIEKLGRTVKQLIVVDDHAVERGACRTDPFSALHHGERPVPLEVEPKALGGRQRAAAAGCSGPERFCIEFTRIQSAQSSLRTPLVCRDRGSTRSCPKARAWIARRLFAGWPLVSRTPFRSG